MSGSVPGVSASGLETDSQDTVAPDCVPERLTRGCGVRIKKKKKGK